MSTDFLNRRMDLIHEFKDGTHYLTMDTSYPVKINGLVLKLFVATSTYKADQVKDDSAGIAFSIKSANNVGSITYEPMITNIKKSNVFNFKNQLLKDDAFVTGDYVMAVIDLFNDKLYICSQTDFSKLVNINDLSDICNFKMFDITEDTADKLAMAVAFQKDGTQPINYNEHFSLTRNGNQTDDSHGDYTVYQLIDDGEKSLKEIPVADTYVSGMNEISVFIHPFSYLSLPGFDQGELASLGYCYKTVIFTAIYGYLNNSFLNNFCIDYDFIKKYLFINDKVPGQTKYSLYATGDDGIFKNYIEYIPDNKKDEYFYILNTDRNTSSFLAFYGSILPIRKSDGLISVIEGSDMMLLYDNNSRFCIDMSGENSKFSGERWGSEKHNTKFIYYIKNEDGSYSLKLRYSNDYPKEDVSVMTQDNYFNNKYNNIKCDDLDLINDPWLFDGVSNCTTDFGVKNNVFNILKPYNISITGSFNLMDGYRLKDNSDVHDTINNYIRDKSNKEEIVLRLLGKQTSNLPAFEDDVKVKVDNDNYKTIYSILYNFDMENVSNMRYPNIFTTQYENINVITIFVNYRFIQSITSNGKTPPTVIYNYINFKNEFNIKSHIPYKFICPVSNSNNIVMKLRSDENIINSNCISCKNKDDSSAIYYDITDSNNNTLTLYTFLNFRIFNFEGDEITIPGTDTNSYYYGWNKTANMRVLDYNISNTKYPYLGIKYFSSITNNSSDATNHGITNVYTAYSSDKKGYNIFIKCKDTTNGNNINCILCIATYRNDASTGYCIVKDFSNSFDNIYSFNNKSETLSDSPYSYCIDSSSRLINVNERIFEFEYNNQTIKIEFDTNGNFKINNSDTIKYYYPSDKDFGSLSSTNESVSGTLNGYNFGLCDNKILKRSGNYNIENDPLLLTSNDDFFLLHDNNENTTSKIDFIEMNTMESQLFNKYLNQFENNKHKIPRINDGFFEDGTLANRNYSIPSITEEISTRSDNSASYYSYLKYIKNHSCLELFNTRKDYADSEKFDQLKNNNIDESIYMDSDGNEKTIYEFYKTILKYYGNGKLKNSFPSYGFSFISKSEIEKTITDSEDHNSIRPHHFLISKKSKDTLDIDFNRVYDSSFVKYSDNNDGDYCYLSTSDRSSEFYQYIYIKKNLNGSNINITRSNNNTEITISFGTNKIFTIGNTFNLHNPNNKIIFDEPVIDENDPDVILIKTKVPVANIYTLYIQNNISISSAITYKKENTTNVISSYNGTEIKFPKGFLSLYNNTNSISISLVGHINTEDYSFYVNTVYFENGLQSSSFLYEDTDILDKYLIYDNNGNKIKLITIGKILPSNYFFQLGEYKDPTDTNKGFIDSSIMKISGNFTENNITNSAYYKLPKIYQSSDSNICKSIVETGLRKSQSIALTDEYGNLLSLNGTEKKEVDKLTWYDLLIALNNNQYIDILGENLLNLKKSLDDNPDIMADLDDLSGIRNDINDIRNNILAKLSIIKFYYEVTDVLNTSDSYDLETIIKNMQELSCLELEIPERDISNDIYYKNINVPYYQTISDVMNNTKKYGGRLTVFKFSSSKIYMEFINRGNDVYFTKQGNIYTKFNDPTIWIKKNSPKVYSEINTNLDYNKDDFINTVSDMNPNSTVVIDFPYNDDINNLDKTSIIYAGAVVFEANSRANPNFNYSVNVTLNCHDEDNTTLTLKSVRTDCAGMTEATVNYLGYNVTHSSDTIGIKVADFYQMTTDDQHIASIKDKQNKTSNNFRLINYSKDSLLPGDLIIYEGRHIEQYIYTDSDGIARGFSGSSSDNLRDSATLATYITDNKSIPDFSSKSGAKLNIDGLNIGLDENLNVSTTATTYQPTYILRYRYINGNNFLPYSIDDDGYLEAGGHLVIQALKPNDNIINLSVEFTNYRNDKYSKYIIMNKIGDLNYYCTFKWISEYVNMNKLNHVLVNWHDAIMEKTTLSDTEKTTKLNEYKADYEKLAEDSEDKKKYDTADKYAEAKLNEYIDSLPEVEKEPAKKEIIYGLTSSGSNHVIELQSFDYKVLNFDQNESVTDNELCLKVFSSIEPSIIFEDITNDKVHTALNSSKLTYNTSTKITNSNRTYRLTVSNPFFTLYKSNTVTKYKEQVAMCILYKRINPDIVNIESE